MKVVPRVRPPCGASSGPRGCLCVSDCDCWRSGNWRERVAGAAATQRYIPHRTWNAVDRHRRRLPCGGLVPDARTSFRTQGPCARSREARVHHDRAEATAGGRCGIRTASWCASPCIRTARERWCGASQPETTGEETHGSRGEGHLRLPRSSSSGLTPSSAAAGGADACSCTVAEARRQLQRLVRRRHGPGFRVGSPEPNKNHRRRRAMRQIRIVCTSLTQPPVPS